MEIIDTGSGFITLGTGLIFPGTIAVTPPADHVSLYVNVIPGNPKVVQLVARFEDGVDVIIAQRSI